MPPSVAATYVEQVTPHGSNSSTRECWALAAVLSLALGLRLWGVGFGLPHLETRPDELEVVQRAIRLLSGDLNPHFFHYPSLYFYALGGLYAVWGGVSTLLGGSWDGFLGGAAVDPARFILIGRFVSAVAGTATVYVVYLIGTRLHSPRAGLLAAGFLAVTHLHVRDSHFATTDVTLTLFLAAAVLHLLDVADRGAMRSYVLAGIFTGLAVSTKYVGLILPGVLVSAHSVRHLRIPDQSWLERARAAWRDPLPWAYLAAGVLAFVVTSPYAVLDWGLFTTHFRFQMSHLSGGHGVDLGVGGIYHLRHTLPKGMGWPLFIAGMAGGGWAMLRHTRRAAVFFLFPALFYLSTATGRTVFLRYMLPMVPFLCVAAGWWIAHWSGGLKRRRTGLTLATVAVLAAGPIFDVLQTNLRLSRTDTRLLAAAWLLDEVEPGTFSVYQTGAQWGALQLPLTADSLIVLRDIAARARPVEGLETLRSYTLMQAEARVAAAGVRSVGFRTVSYSTEAGFPGDELPDWIAVMRSPLEQYSAVPPELEAILDGQYSLAHESRATRPGAGTPGWYDQHDAFYLPFKRLGSVSRPGPNVTLYRRVSTPDAIGTTPGEDR